MSDQTTTESPAVDAGCSLAMRASDAEDYDLLTVGDEFILRTFNTLAVNAWNVGRNVRIVGFLTDGRLIVQDDGSILTNALAQGLGLPEGTYVVSRSHIERMTKRVQ